MIRKDVVIIKENTKNEFETTSQKQKRMHIYQNYGKLKEGRQSVREEKASQFPT